MEIFVFFGVCVTFFWLVPVVYSYNRLVSPTRKLRREQKRNRKIALELEKAFKALSKEAEALEKLRQAERFLTDLATPDAFMREIRQVSEMQPRRSGRLKVMEYLRSRILPLSGSAIAEWMNAWIEGDWVPLGGRYHYLSVRSSSDGWDAARALTLAIKFQRAEWAIVREKKLVKARRLQKLVDSLSKDLGIEPVQLLAEKDREKPTTPIPVRAPEDDMPRAKLAKIRVDIAELQAKANAIEQEILDEQPADAPHRRPAGVSTNN